jgi:hypothetical protein
MLDSEEDSFHYGAPVSSCQFNNDFSVLQTITYPERLDRVVNIPTVHTSSSGWRSLGFEEKGDEEKVLSVMMDTHTRGYQLLVEGRELIALALKYLRTDRLPDFEKKVAEFGSICAKLQEDIFLNNSQWEVVRLSFEIGLSILAKHSQKFSSDFAEADVKSLEDKLELLENNVSKMCENVKSSLSKVDLKQWASSSASLASFVSISSIAVFGVLKCGVDKYIPSKKSAAKLAKKNPELTALVSFTSLVSF